MTGRKAAGGRGRPSRGRPSMRGTHLPANDENVPPAHATANSADTASGPRRSSRVITASERADIGLLQQMRRGNIRVPPRRAASESPRASEEEAELSREDISRERGDGSSDDEFIDHSSRRQAQHNNVADHLESRDVDEGNQAAGSGAIPSNSPFSASMRPFTGAAASRLSSLQGPHTHTIPGLSLVGLSPGDTLGQSPSIRSLVRPVPDALVAEIQAMSRYPGRSSQLGALSTATNHTEPGDSDEAVRTPQRRTAIEREELDPEERRRLKKAKHNAERPRFYHYSYDTRLLAVLETASNLLEVYFSTVNPFPSIEERAAVVIKKFAEAKAARGVNMEEYVLTKAQAKLLANAETTVRGNLKRATMNQLADAFAIIRLPKNTAEIEANRERVRFLLYGPVGHAGQAPKAMFHYAQPEQNQGRFRHPLIAKIIHEVYFSGTSALGCLYQDDFNPMPHPTIANVCTVMHHGLTLFASGEKSEGRYSKEMYPIFDDYLGSLDQFGQERIWLMYLSGLFTEGLQNAGGIKEAPRQPVVGTIPQSEVDQEMAALEAEMMARGVLAPPVVTTNSAERASGEPLSDTDLRVALRSNVPGPLLIGSSASLSTGGHELFQ